MPIMRNYSKIFDINLCKIFHDGMGKNLTSYYKIFPTYLKKIEVDEIEGIHHQLLAQELGYV